jgi:glycosyltransferase involved in cell wall biosynthesis/thioredoxin-like negative regulator of GroEL
LELHIYGYCDPEYRTLLESIDVKCRIIFHGGYDKYQLNGIASQLDLVVIPSIWEDCAPLVVQEVLAMGLPVIGSDLGGITDFIEDGYNGIIYDHSDSLALRDILLDIISNPTLLIELHNNCTSPMSFNDYLNHLVKIYTVLINNEPLKREDIELDFKEALFGKQAKSDITAIPTAKSNEYYLNLDGTSTNAMPNLYNKNERQSLYNAGLCKINLDDCVADRIVLEKILEYSEDDNIKTLLNEVKRVLKPTGKLEIITTDMEEMAKMLSTGAISISTFNNIIFEKNGFALVNSFNKVRLNEILKSQGYENIEIETRQSNNSLGVSKPLIIAKGTKSEENSVQTAPLRAHSYSEDFVPQLNIVWEGTQFVYHSLALINREQCSNIIDAEVANLTIVPYEPEKFNPKGNNKFEKLYWHDIRVKPDETPKEKLPYVWIRHQWPPKNEVPKGAKWIVNQPWEFSLLTNDIKEVFDNADEVWTPSTWCRKVYIDSGVSPDKIQVIPNGIDPELFTPYGKQYVLKTKKKVKFLFVGGTIYRKGIDILLDTFVATFTKHDDVCLIIKDMGGDSFYKGQTAKEYIHKLQLIDDAPEIEYIDEMLETSDIASLYRSCDVFVSPYRGEGFSLPTLEAMASGLPVMVTKGGATDDFVDESVGWLINASQKPLGQTMGEREFVGQAYLLEPDKEDLKIKLRQAYENSTSLISIGLLASLQARTNFTWRKSTLKVLKRLDAIYGTEMAPKAMLKLPELRDAYILLGQAEQAFNNFDYETALNLYREVVESGQLSDSYESLAIKETVLIMLNIGEYELAHQFLESFNPADVDYQYLKAKTLAFGGEYEEALEFLTKIMNDWQTVKNDSQISLSLDHILAFTGEIMATMGDLEGAMQIYMASLEINETNIDALFGIGELHIENGNLEEAKNYLEKTLVIYPEHTAATELLEGILQTL